MGSLVVVEVLDRRGRVRERHRLSSFPATIGRAYGCDILIDDPHVSPEHLRLETAESGLRAIDLDSTNGTYDIGRATRIEEAELSHELQLRLGETTLRFRQAADLVAPAVPIRPGWMARLPMGTLWWAAAAWAIAALLAVAAAYLRTYEELRIEALLGEFTAVTMGIALWGGLWAVGNRIVSHQFHYVEHCLNGALWGTLMTVASRLDGYLAFALDADKSVAAVLWILNTVLFAALLYGHLRLCTVMVPRQVGLTSAGIALTIGSLSALGSVANVLEEPKWDFLLHFRRELKPPMFRLTGSQDIDHFFANGPELKQRVDDLAREKP